MANIVQYVLQLRNQISAPLAQAQAAVQRFQQSLFGAQQQAQKTASSASGIGSMVAGAFSVAAVGMFAKSIITAGANMEQTRVQFETFAGSAEKGNEVIAKLQKFSLATPFEDEQVLKAGKSLMAFGTNADDLEKVLTRIGNISSATGKDFNELTTIYGKAKTAGTLYAEDINQLVEAGIPIIDEFAKQLGVPTSQVKKLASEGKISFGMLEKGFDNLGGASGKWGALMEKQSQTVAGKWSSMVGYAQNMMSSLGEGQIPFLNKIIDTGIAVLDWISTNRNKFGAMFDPLVQAVQPLMSAMQQVMSTLGITSDAGTMLESVFNFIGNTIKVISPFIEGLATVIGKVWVAVAQVIGIFKTYLQTNKDTQSSLLVLYNAFKTVFGMIADIAGKVLGGIVKTIDGIVNSDFSKIGSGLKDIVTAPLEVAFNAKSYAPMNDKAPEYTNFFAKDNTKPAGVADAARSAAKGAKDALATKAADDKKTKVTTKVGDVSGSKPTTINVTIQKMTGVETLHTVNMKESVQDIKALIMEMLTAGVTDFTLLAGGQ